MKTGKKYIVVPFNNYQSPIKQYVSNLDKEMSEILNNDMPDDKKFIIYNNLLKKYKDKFDPNLFNDQAKITDLITDFKQENQDNFNNLITKVKEEQKEISDMIDVKLEPSIQNIAKLDRVNKGMNILNTTKLNKLNTELVKIKKDKSERAILKASKKLETNPYEVEKKKSKIKSLILKNKEVNKPNDNITDDESFMDTSVINGNKSLLNQALLKDKPLTTRASKKEYETLYKKSPEFILNNINNINNDLNKLSLNGNGLGILWIKNKKYF
jgi:hypothetical protein